MCTRGQPLQVHLSNQIDSFKITSCQFKLRVIYSMSMFLFSFRVLLIKSNYVVFFLIACICKLLCNSLPHKLLLLVHRIVYSFVVFDSTIPEHMVQ